jgi:hypothetical protein
MLRKENTLISDGKGHIEVRTTQGSPGSAIGLYSHSKPIVLNWHDCGGSIAQEFLYHYSFTPDENIMQMRRLVDDGLSEERSLASQTQPLLSLFPSGEYELILEDILSDWSLFYPEDTISAMIISYGFYYPYSHIFLQHNTKHLYKRIVFWSG